MSDTKSYLSSYLTSPKYGYDFVVATTQASINSDMKEYLNGVDQPTTTLCFLADTKGNPTTQISLEDLKAKTGGIDPFDIPDGTDYSDPRITTLTKNMFMVGLKLKVGLPPGVLPVNMPPIVDLGSSASNVKFNLFCSEFVVIQNSPPSGFGGSGSWNVWSQPSGTPWYFTTTVDLVFKDLNNELDTPYFNSHPQQKAALLAQLENLGSGAFSLQQLLFDLDNAAIQSIPKIAGLDPSSDAGLILTKSFVNLYFASARAQGEPVLSVHAEADTPDNSSLRLTAMEREVGQFVDGNGVIVANPTPQQKEVVTLQYLCAANNNPLPGAALFNFNWVDPADVDNESGVIAVNRNTLATYYKNTLWPLVKKSCIGVKCNVTHDSDSWISGKVHYNGTFTQGKTPVSFDIPATGNTVLNIDYNDYCEDDTRSGATYGQLKLWSNFHCSVSFQDKKITVVQNLKMSIYVEWDATGVTCDFFDKTITDTYTLSIGQNGSLQLSTPKSSTQDDSKQPDRSWLVNLFTGVNDIVNSFTSQLSDFLNASITDIPAASIQNFVFPGAKVFTYKEPQFSDNQDLVSTITYVTPK